MAASVVRCIPTKVGDVLILQTRRTFTVYAVGAVSKDGQQDFGKQGVNTQHVSDRATALTLAKALRLPGGQIFLCDIDTEAWSEVSP